MISVALYSIISHEVTVAWRSNQYYLAWVLSIYGLMGFFYPKHEIGIGTARLDTVQADWNVTVSRKAWQIILKKTVEQQQQKSTWGSAPVSQEQESALGTGSEKRNR